MYSAPPSQSGDIIFLSPESKSPNTKAQSIIRRKSAIHSHVAVAVKQGNAIHAMPKDGVHVTTIHSLLTERGIKFSVFRKKDLKSNEERLCRLEDKLWYFNRQKYNFWLFFRPRTNASFCSELVAKAYEAIGVKISERRPSATLPVDIHNFVHENVEWENITKTYENFFLTHHYTPGDDLASNFVRQIEEMNQNMTQGQRLLINRLNKICKKNKMEPTRKYWNTHKD
jgi:hypothetical protein